MRSAIINRHQILPGNPPESIWEEEAFVVDSPSLGQGAVDESEDEIETESEEGDEDVNVKKRFQNIRDELKLKKVDLSNEVEFQQFLAQNENVPDQKTDDEHRTLLHFLIEDIRDKDFKTYEPLLNHLLGNYPDFLAVKDGNDRTPLSLAIHKQRDRLTRIICDNHPNIDSILGIQGYRQENCLHVAV